MDRNCFIDICKNCKYRGKLNIFKKYKCDLDKKPIKDDCPYCKCEGGMGEYCTDCNYYCNKDNR